MRTHFLAHRRINIFLLIAILGANLCAVASAQAYKKQVVFLEEFATRLYAQGDYANALKEFNRINRLDPLNVTAAEHIRLIAQKAGSKPVSTSSNLERIDSIITDITGLKNNLIRYDNDNNGLVSLIRNLITENDALYTMLSLRTREIIELRSKFHGTPYAETYEVLIKSLGPDRVPQHLHQSNELLSLIGEQSAGITINAAAITDEAQSLIQSVVSQKKALASTAQNRAMADAVNDKREILVDKTLATINQQDGLSRISANLTEINATLKNIDAYYQSIRSGIAARNLDEQQQFAELMADYAAKLKEIDALRDMVEITDKKIAPSREALATQAASLSVINETLLQKDKQIANYKNLLAEQGIIIAKQKTDLTSADKALDKTSAKLTSIEDLLEQNDQGLAELQDGVSKVRLLVKAKKSSIPGESLQQETRDNELAQARTKLVQTQAIVAVLTDENTVLRTINDERGTFFAALQAQLAGLSVQTKNKDAALSEQQKALSAMTTQMEKLENRVSAARTELAANNQELRDARSRIRTLEAEFTRAESSAQRSKAGFLEQQELATEKSMEVNKLKNELAALISAENLKVKPLAASVSQPMPIHPAKPVAVPEQAKEVAALREKIIQKDAAILALEKQLSATAAALQEKSVAKIDAEKIDAQCHDLDLEEKNAALAKLHNDLLARNETIREKEHIIQLADEESAKLQEKLSILEAKQDAIKGVIQKRDMEFMRVSVETEVKDKDLALMTKERDALKAKISDAQNGAALAESRLEMREEEIAQLNKEISALHTTAVNAHEEIARLNFALKKLEK